VEVRCEKDRAVVEQTYAEWKASQIEVASATDAEQEAILDRHLVQCVTVVNREKRGERADEEWLDIILSLQSRTVALLRGVLGGNPLLVRGSRSYLRAECTERTWRAFRDATAAATQAGDAKLIAGALDALLLGAVTQIGDEKRGECPEAEWRAMLDACPFEHVIELQRELSGANALEEKAGRPFGR